MAALGLQRLPVVESEQSQKLLGVVSRSDLLKPARQLHEEESRRERFLRRSFSSPPRNFPAAVASAENGGWHRRGVGLRRLRSCLFLRRRCTGFLGQVFHVVGHPRVPPCYSQ